MIIPPILMLYDGMNIIASKLDLNEYLNFVTLDGANPYTHQIHLVRFVLWSTPYWGAIVIFLS